MTDTKTLLNELRGKGVLFFFEREGYMSYAAHGDISRTDGPVIEAHYEALSELIKREAGCSPPKQQLSPRELAATGLSQATIEALQRVQNQSPIASPSHEPEDPEIPYHVYMG